MRFSASGCGRCGGGLKPPYGLSVLRRHSMRSVRNDRSTAGRRNSRAPGRQTHYRTEAGGRAVFQGQFTTVGLHARTRYGQAEP